LGKNTQLKVTMAGSILPTPHEQMWITERKIIIDISTGFKVKGEIDKGNTCRMPFRGLNPPKKTPTRNEKEEHVCQIT
jgi:hypothetical protein